MKIRLDFVSNSSSSSFMLVGHVYTCDEIEEAWAKLHPTKNVTPYAVAYMLSQELNLECKAGISNYYDEWAIGLGFDKMKDNETKREFMDRIKTSLSKAFAESSVGICIDGGYDG